MAQGAPTATAMAQADLRSWVRAKVTELEGFEDQVVIDSVCRRLDDVQLDRAAFAATATTNQTRARPVPPRSNGNTTNCRTH